MVSFLSPFYNYFFMLVLLLGMSIAILFNRSMDERTNTCFGCILLLVLVLMCAEYADSLLATLPAPSIFRYFTSALGYTLRPAFPVLLITILLRRRRTGLLLWAPVFVLTALCFTSGLTHLIFWFDARNYFMRGPLGYLPHYLSAFYLLLLVWLTFRLYRFLSVGEIFTVMYSVALCIAATLLESFTSLRFLLAGVILVSCVLYYIILCTQTYQCDVLTGLRNRGSCYADARRLKGRNGVILSVDLNGLKDLNDLQGHSAGDKALRALAQALQQKSGRHFRAYRVGGDEFLVIGKEQTLEAAGAFVSEVREELRRSGLSASFGCAAFCAKDSFDDICNEADACMYEDKKRYKHRRDPRDL